MFWWECTSWIGSNCVAKANLKGAPGIDITTLASKADLTSLKTKVDNLDADKLKTILADLSKWSNVKDNDVVKKSVCDKVVIKVSAIGIKIPSTTGLLIKTLYDSEKQAL